MILNRIPIYLSSQFHKILISQSAGAVLDGPTSGLGLSPPKLPLTFEKLHEVALTEYLVNPVILSKI